jgi:hypothetical protein
MQDSEASCKEFTNDSDLTTLAIKSLGVFVSETNKSKAPCSAYKEHYQLNKLFVY